MGTKAMGAASKGQQIDNEEGTPMKSKLWKIVALIVSALLLVGGLAEESITAEPGLLTQGEAQIGDASQDERVQLVKCPEQDFATACREGLEWAFMDDGTGMNIWTDTRGSIPYLLIWRNRGGGSDVEAYFRDVFTPQMQADYGDRLIEIGQFQTYTIQGIALQGQQYTYLVGDVPVVLLKVLDTRFGGSVCYTAKFCQDDPQATLEALAIAVYFYRDSASAYDAGSADPAPTEGGPNTSGGGAAINATPVQRIVTETYTYNDGRFTMEIPVGWKIITTGTSAADLSVRVYDPECPERTFYRAGKAQPFLRSQAAKDWYGQYAGLGFIYAAFADAPALEELTVACYVRHMGDLRDYGKKYAGNSQFLDYNVCPEVYNAQILEARPSGMASLPTCYDNSLVRVAFTSERGVACQGMITAQPTRIEASVYMNGVDISPDIVYDSMGFMAPEGELIELEDALSRCLTSFRYDEEFIRQSVRAAGQEAEIIRQMAENMQSAYDSYNSAWESREATYDILSQERSDATLGYDRLYDTETGEIYRAELGFWDDYSQNPYAYDNPNLKIIDDSTKDYYLKGVDYTITR